MQQQTGVAAQQEQPQKMRMVTPLARQTEGTLPAAESQPEMIQARIDQREPTTSPLSEQPGTAKTMATAHSGASNTANSENETADRGMNGNFPSHVLHQQAKSESSSAVNAASGVVLDEVPRSNLPSEQVVQQVRDRFAAHEAKPGSEQIVLRLSPDHLGELKVNLNLEGQRLRVEIVAENRMVRDSLMQHTDALKESLSRQNIKMESFDVTTGGNSSTDSGRSQGDWRELAQQRQHNAWMPNGGYRVATQAVPAAAAYRIKSEHSMVDLHY